MVKILFIMRQMQFKIIPSRGTSAQLLCEKERALFLKITSSTVSWFFFCFVLSLLRTKRRDFGSEKIISLRFQKNLWFWITRILEPDLLKRFILSGDNHKIGLNFCQFLSLLFYFYLFYFARRERLCFISLSENKNSINRFTGKGMNLSRILLRRHER